MSATHRRYATGLPFLDRRLDGGIPVGTLLTMTAPAGSQSELLLYQFATSQPMLYLSTTAPMETELRTAIDSSSIQPPKDLTFEHVPSGELLADPDQYLDQIRPESFVVIDPIDRLESADDESYLAFVNSLKRYLHSRDSVGVFHALSGAASAENRWLTLQRSDTVWHLEQHFLSREIVTRLMVTKARQGRALTEPISLILSDKVLIDTSRRIS